MKTMMNLKELAAEVSRQQEAKRDFVADTRRLSLTSEGFLRIETGKSHDAESFAVRPQAHRQIGSYLNIPATYYDRLLAEAPDLLADNVNTWLGRKSEKRMVRTIDGDARALLSDRYRRLDNADLIEAILPTLGGMRGVTFESCAITESRLHVKAVLTNTQAEIRKGDLVQAGLAISNSEVGGGAVKVEPFVYRLICLNGMKANVAQRKFHVGKQIEVDGGAELFSDEALMADDKAFWLKVRDVVAATAAADTFEKIVARLRESTEEKIETRDFAKVVELTSRRFGFSTTEGQGVLAHLIEGGDMTRYGLIQAVTRHSQDVESYDRADELEAVGGQILDLPRSDWRSLAEAA